MTTSARRWILTGHAWPRCATSTFHRNRENWMSIKWLLLFRLGRPRSKRDRDFHRFSVTLDRERQRRRPPSSTPRSATRVLMSWTGLPSIAVIKSPRTIPPSNVCCVGWMPAASAAPPDVTSATRTPSSLIILRSRRMLFGHREQGQTERRRLRGAGPDQLRHDRVDGVDRYGKSNSRKLTGGLRMAVVTPINPSGAIQQRPARIARIDRRVDLNHVLDRFSPSRLDLPPQAADDAGRQ